MLNEKVLSSVITSQQGFEARYAGHFSACSGSHLVISQQGQSDRNDIRFLLNFLTTNNIKITKI
jgi:hypothetical protein